MCGGGLEVHIPTAVCTFRFYGEVRVKTKGWGRAPLVNLVLILLDLLYH